MHRAAGQGRLTAKPMSCKGVALVGEGAQHGVRDYVGDPEALHGHAGDTFL